MRKKENELVYYLVVFVAGIMSVYPWFRRGIAPTDDLRAHVFHTWFLKYSIFNYGYVTSWLDFLYSGMPILKFYSPLSYYLNLPATLIMHPVSAVKFGTILASVLAGFSIYFSVVMLFKRRDVGVVAAICYVFFPYHFNLTAIRGAYHELWGYALLPFAMALFIKTLKEPNRRMVLYTSLAFGAMFLTHIPTGYMLVLAALACFVYHAIRTKSIKNWKSLVIILVVSLSLVAFWTVPFLAYSKEANFGDFYQARGTRIIGLQATKGVTFYQLFARNWGFIQTSYGQDRAFYVGLSLTALVLLSLAYKNEDSRYFLIVALVGLLIMLSIPLTNIMPMISLLQFTIRLCVLVGVGFSIVAATSLVALAQSFRRYASPQIILMIGVVIILLDLSPGVVAHNWTTWETEYFVNPPQLAETWKQMKSLKTPAQDFLVLSVSGQVYNMYHELPELGYDWEGFRQGPPMAIQNAYDGTYRLMFDHPANITYHKLLGYYGVKYFVWPCLIEMANVSTPVYQSGQACVFENLYFTERVVSPSVVIRDPAPDIIEYLEADEMMLLEECSGSCRFKNVPAQISGIYIQNKRVRFSVSSEENSWVLVKVSKFSGWKAYVDGSKVEIRKAWPAYMAIIVPEGQHDVEFRYGRTWLEWLTLLFSLAVLGGVLWMLYEDRRSKQVQE